MSEVNLFFDDDALLILDENKKIMSCNQKFLTLFGFDEPPVGAAFDALFRHSGGTWEKRTCWQPFSCEMIADGSKADGLMFCEEGRVRIVFSSMPTCGGSHEDMLNAQLASLVSQMKEGVAVHRLVLQDEKAVDYVVEDFNKSFAELFGFDHDQTAGQSASLIFGTKKAPFLNKFEQAVKAGKPTQFDAFYAGSGRHYLISVTPFSQTRFGTVVSDLSQSRHSQLLYKALNEAAAVVSGTEEADDIFTSVAHILKKYGFECILMPIDEGAAVKKAYFSFSKQRIAHDHELIPAVDMGYGEAANERRAVYIESLDIPQQLLKDGIEKDLRCIASPLVIGGALAGFFVIMSKGLKRNDMEAVTAFANQLAAMMEKASLIGSLRSHIEEIESSKKELDIVAERLKMASQASRVGVWDIDLVRSVEYMDSALQKIYGMAPGTFDGSMASWQKFVHPDDRERVAEAYQQAMCTGGDYAAEYRIVLPDGTVRYISSVGVLHSDETGTPVRMVGTDWDITGRKNVELALMAEKELLKTTLKSIGDGVMVTDSEGRITLANVQFAKLCGIKLEQIHGLKFSEVALGIFRQDSGRCRLPDKTLRTGRVMKGTDCELARRDGKTVPVAYTVAPIRNNEEAICGTVLVIRNSTEEKERQQKIDYLVNHDPLTGVYNRRYFDQMVKKFDKPSKLPLSVLSCDVNGLKLTNDAFGHSEGDKLLKRMASIMTKASRPGDIVARVGGDEFLILMQGADQDQAEQTCKNIKALVAKKRPLAIDDSVSVGYDTKTCPQESMREVINRAELHMYSNKTYESPKMKDSTIKSILETLYERYPDERVHVKRVAQICCDIARQMGLGEREIADIRTLAVMRDIGNIAVDQAILNKPGKLTEEEWQEIKRHPEVGFRILLAFNEMAHIAGNVLSHHERYDGEGYPNGISGEQIPLLSRIVSVAIAYDAMISERPYRKAFARELALKEIADNKGTQFDPAVAEEFLRMMDNYVM